MHEMEASTASVEQHSRSPKGETWQADWAEQGQPWRTEPEISAERQAELATRRCVTPDVLHGIYPFSGMKLKRADVEWLLATHEDGRGPVDYHDPSQSRRVGLDLRGADLSYAQLQNLPLARLVADVTWRTWENLTEKQHRKAAIQLQHADLKGAFLEGASLEYANLEGADLRGCHLEEANLGTANMQRAYCEGAHFEGADLWYAHLGGAFLWRAHFQGARFYEAHLQSAHLDGLVLANEDHIGPRLVDTHWEDANLAVVDWSQIRMLGDEYEARQMESEGTRKELAVCRKEFEDAVRANRQLAMALQAQGLNEDAARFFYRSQVLQRKVFALQRPRKLGSYLFSWLLALLTGYGYRMWRIIICYLVLIALYATLYYTLSLSHHISVLEAIILSVTAFHGRVFSSPFQLASAQGIVEACEAVNGLIFEGIFIAMLTQRFFGK